MSLSVHGPLDRVSPLNHASLTDPTLFPLFLHTRHVPRSPKVTREIARVNDAAITHTRRRACCMGTQHASKTRARTQRQVARGSKLRSSTPTVRVHTADLSLEKRKPSIPERVPTVMPISGRKTLRNAHAVSAAFQLAKGGMPTCRQPVPHRGSGIGDGRDELLRPKLISAEQKLASNGIADASNQEIPESLHETGADCSSSEVSSPDRHLRETSSSDEEFDGEWSNGSPRGPCSSDNGLISSSGDDEGVLSPAISCGEEKSKPAESSRGEESNRGGNCSSFENEAEGGRVISGKQKPRNTCRRNRKSRRRARGSHKENGGEAATCSRVALDEAWSNRSLTVLLADLGLYQSCQRTALSKHMPAGLKGDAIGEGKRGRSPPPRIDRPHFRPAFVELPAAGKGRTVSL